MTPAEQSGRERILASALRLFADRGVSGVTVRDIAADANVSPANVLHHFTSKRGLVDAVDAHVAGFFERVLGSDPDAREALAGQGPDPAASLGEAFARAISAGQPLARYLSRMILEHDQRATTLLQGWIAQTGDLMARLGDTGTVRPADDPAVRAAFLVINDLAVLLLREHLTVVLGWDPVTPDGLVRWSRTVMDVYTEGVFVPGSPATTATSPQTDHASEEDA